MVDEAIKIRSTRGCGREWDLSTSDGHEFVAHPVRMSHDGFHASAADYARIADALAPAATDTLTRTDGR